MKSVYNRRIFVFLYYITMIFTNNNYTDKEMNKIIIMGKLINKVININEAMWILYLSERQIYRYMAIYKFEWAPWLTHWLKNRPSNNKVERRKLDWIKSKILSNKYKWFWPTLLAEELSNEMWYEINHETLRLATIRWWNWIPNKKKLK